MPSKKKHRKGATKDKNEDNTYEKLSCNRKPKHSACDGKWVRLPKRGPEGGVEWVVEWAPCREDDAVRFMKEKHGYIFNRKSRNENDTKPEKRYSEKKHPKLNGFIFSAPRPSHKHKPAKGHGGKCNTREQAAGRPRNEHRQRAPPTPAETPAERDARGAKILEMFQRESRTQGDEKQKNDQRVDAWMAEHEGPETAIHSNPVPPEGIASSPDMALNPRMMQPQSTYTAGTGNMVPAPVMPSPQDATPGGKHQKHRHQRSSNNHKPEHEPQPSTTVPPRAIPDGGERRPHRSRHARAKPEQEQQPSATFQPPRTMPAGLASPMGTSVPPRVPPIQGATDGHYQRHQPVPTGHSTHGQGPQPPEIMPPAPAPALAPAPATYASQAPPDGQRPSRRHQKSSRKPEAELGEARQPPAAMIPPPGSMRECMANLAERAMSVHRPGGPQGHGGDVHAAGPSNMPPPPPPMNTTMPVGPAAEDISLLPAAQPGPGMPRLPRTHLLPTAPPQAGDMAATAGGGPGPQVMPARSSRRAPPEAGPAMTPRPRMEPPPMSMPPFPGTDPGDPVPFDPSMSPPPSAPTPLVLVGALD